MWLTSDDPVRDAEESAEYLEDHGEEIPESDFYKGLCEIYEIINEYNREMKKGRKDVSGTHKHSE